MMPQSDNSLLATTVASLLRAASTRLSGPEVRREAELLLEHVLGVDRAWLFAHTDHVLDADTAARFAALVERRATGEPLAYLIGHTGFWNLELRVTPATLIPRPETELLVEIALEQLPLGVPLRIADLGTGSGAIALALASERPEARVVATDAGAEALAVAQDNARRNELTNVAFLEGDWFQPLHGQRFHLIASNPPYVADADPHLSQGDLRYEPALALSCGTDGLNAIRHIAAHAPAHLEAGAWLLIEHGYLQGEAVRELLRVAGFIDIQTRRDLEQRERVTLGRTPS